MTYNPKHQIVSPECILIGTKYTFTYSPDDNHQFWNASDRIPQFATWITQLFNLPAHIDGYLEISRTGRLHFHGTIEFPKELHIRMFFVEKLKNIIDKGIVEIDTIKDIVDWLVYCRKSEHIIDVRIKNNPLNVNRAKESWDQRIDFKKIPLCD